MSERVKLKIQHSENRADPSSEGATSADRTGHSITISEPKRIQQLDLLRGLAILLVLIHHSGGLVGNLGRFTRIYRSIQGFGWTGVDLFFVLSGFLIGGILFREIERNGRLRVRRFLLRRVFKIWPGYLALVIFALLKDSRHAENGQGLAGLARTYWANFLHLQNYFPNIRFHTWSLAVEEHFYLLLPLLLGSLALASAGTVRRWFPPIAVLLIGLIALFRAVHGIFVPFTYETHMYATHLRLDSLLMGVLLAHLATFSPDRFARLRDHHRLMLLAGLALICPMLWLDLDRSLFVQTAGFSLLYLGYGCILVGTLGIQHGKGLSGTLLASMPVRVISGIGLFSYAIYLWHIDLAVRPMVKIAPMLQSHLPPAMASVISVMCVIAMACTAGMLLTFLIEKPALALRDRLVPAEPRKHREIKAPLQTEIQFTAES
jgi:peptidoglycan/LPS O-acetylase OafA/YrhL